MGLWGNSYSLSSSLCIPKSVLYVSLSLFFFLCWEIQGKKQENKALVMGCWACVLASPVNTAIGWSCAVIAPQQAGSYYSKWSNLLSSLCFAPLKKKKKKKPTSLLCPGLCPRVSEVVLLHTTPKQGCRPCNQAVLCRPHSLNQSIFSILWVLC